MGIRPRILQRLEVFVAGHEEQYVVDENGNRVSVVLDVEEHQKLIQSLEELDSIPAYDRAKASGDQVIPFEQAVTEIETNRK
jgi:hypothetical protein